MSIMELSSEEWIASIWPVLLQEINIMNAEMKIIKTLTQNKEIFLKLEKKVQRIIQQGTENPNNIRIPTSGDIIINNIYYELFDIQFQATLRIYNHLHGNALMTVWKTIPNIKTKYFRINYNTYTISSKTNVMVIDNTNHLLRECKEGAEKIIDWHCRTKETKDKNIPMYLRKIIVKYMTVNLNTFKESWTK